MNTRRSSRLRPPAPRRAFTLVEILIVLVIVGIIATLVVANAPEYLRRGRVTAVLGAADSIRTAANAYVTKSTGLHTLPLTEGTIPSSMYTGTGTSSANVAAAATLDKMLLTEGMLAKPIVYKMGLAKLPTGTSAVSWDSANMAWTGSTPTVSYAGTSRAECITSSSATPGTDGSNFFLDGTASLPANVRVAFLLLKDVPAEDAYQLSLAIDGEAMSGASNAVADTRGSVAYAAPINGVSDVYVYVVHM